MDETREECKVRKKWKKIRHSKYNRLWSEFLMSILKENACTWYVYMCLLRYLHICMYLHLILLGEYETKQMNNLSKCIIHFFLVKVSEFYVFSPRTLAAMSMYLVSFAKLLIHAVVNRERCTLMDMLNITRR